MQKFSRKTTAAAAIAALMMMPMMSGTAFAEQKNPQLKALDDALPGTVINDPTRLDWQVFGPGAASKPVKGADIPGGNAAIQVTIPVKGPTAYQIGMNAPITAAIKLGEDIVVAFYARTISADTPDGNGRIALRIQMNAAPYSGFGDASLSIGKEWKLYEVPSKSTIAISKGLAVVGFQLSGEKQIVEIGQTIVVSGATSLTAKPASAPAQSATTDLLPQLQGKGQLISNPGDKNWATYGGNKSFSTIKAANIPGTGGTAMLVNTPSPTPNIFDIGANVAITEKITEGDVILIAVLARTAPNGTADGISKLAVRVQLNEAPYDGFGDNILTLGPNWKLLQLRTQAKSTIPAGKGVLALHFGAGAQAIEVGQAYVLNTSSISTTTSP